MPVVFALALLITSLMQSSAVRAADRLDLTNAQIVAPTDLSGPERKAVEMLVNEVERRTLVRWSVTANWPDDKSVPVVAVGPLSTLASFAGPLATPPLNRKDAEGFAFEVQQPAGRAPAVLVCGNDARGVLFGVGYLLRKLEMSRGEIVLPSGNYPAFQAPAYPIRGHQLGYRPKTNSYDAWDLPQWEQYIRDLAVFGCNAIELIPPRSDDDANSPHFPRPQIEMMEGMSRLADEHGIDVWIWYPALDEDYSEPETVAFALKEWAGVLRRLPRVDAIFVPTGDPGHTPPTSLFPMLAKQAAQLVKLHPGAETWISVQSFDAKRWDEVMSLLAEEPDWLAGVVYGPQTRVTLRELRDALPKRYRIRRYPDITHSMRCEYPVPDWDVAYAFTEAREPINPRPRDQADFFAVDADAAAGFITYSEGCNDDVNKVVWSTLGWDANARVEDALRDYGRYFFGPEQADDVAQGLLALECNWNGPLLTNGGVATTLAQWQDLERRATPADKLNWRFQQALYRAYYDAYNRARLTYETALEAQALDTLRQAEAVGSLEAIERAEAILRRAETEPVAQDLRARVFELAEALYQSVRMQLSVDRYQAIDVGRGANLDTIDVSLNNRPWLEAQFASVRKLDDERARRRAIEAIVRWDDPRPGGFYDDLGNLARQPHVVGFVPRRPREQGSTFANSRLGFHREPGWRTSWCDFLDGLYVGSVEMAYDGLDPAATYQLRVVYAGDNDEVHVKAATKSGVEIHPWIAKPRPPKPLEFDLPAGAVVDGRLELVFEGQPGRGGPGRGPQVAEVWLIKKRPE